MYEFDFWYAYFDSLFLKNIPQPHPSFVETFDLHELGRQTFPECKKLPELTRCFQEFQKFISTPETWIESECEETVLTEVEDFINLCVILIQIEKKYAQDFWHLKRRIQASICHFFAILLFLISSLIPDEKLQNIEETKKCNKLCTSLKSLEIFVNKILPEMNSIIKFLYQESFSEEKKLTILFLQQIKEVLLNLPKVNKNKIRHQFELSKYLYLIIPIELSKNQYKFKARRKKAVTISNEIEMKYHSDEFASRESRNDSDNEITDQKRKFSLSKLHENKKKEIYRTKIIKRQPINQYNEDFYEDSCETETILPKLFNFSEKVRKCSFYISQKKVTKATLKTRETIELKLEAEKLRKKSNFSKISESYVKEKEFDRTFSIQKRREKTIETERSKKSSFYRAHRKTEIEESEKLRHHKEKSLIRKHLKDNYDANEIILKPFYENEIEIPSKKINFYEGKSKGWGVIQDEFNKKSILKNIQKLIHSNEGF